MSKGTMAMAPRKWIGRGASHNKLNHGNNRRGTRMCRSRRHSMSIYLIGFLLASKVVASMLPGVQPKTRNMLLHLKTQAK
jgi:hypothetical protein